MGTRRTGVVLAAVAVGIIAGLAVHQYLTTVQERANRGAKLADEFVVKHLIEEGTPGELAIQAGWIQRTQFNVRFRPLTALADLGAIRGKRAATNLAANQVAVDGQFVDPADVPVTSAVGIAEGQAAITLAFDDVTGVARLIQPGDKVNMLMLLEDEERYLLQNVEVLFVGRTAAPKAGESQPTTQPADESSGLITFAVTHENAARIAFANARADEGGIHLTLVPPDNEPEDVRRIDLWILALREVLGDRRARAVSPGGSTLL